MDAASFELKCCSPPQAAFHHTADSALDPAAQSLVELGHALKNLGYRFTTVTPSTHARVISRRRDQAASLTEIFGWNRPFRRNFLDARLATLAGKAGILRSDGSFLRSAVRFSTLEHQLYVHSAYPTDQADAVFFGPDTYRFARLIRSAMAVLQRRHIKCSRVLDIGAGSGAGGLYAAALAHWSSPIVTLTDVNLRALRYCRVNAGINRIDDVQVVKSDLLANISGTYDLIVANPPYLVDKLKRTYRHGGGGLGANLSIRLVEESIPHLARGGRLILYTGSAIIRGRDYLHEALSSQLDRHGLCMVYEEIDPDVFGEELDHPPYDRADRIAVVSASIEMPKGDKHAPTTS